MTSTPGPAYWTDVPVGRFQRTSWLISMMGISVTTAANEPAFPDLSTSRDSLRLYATCRLKDNVSLRAGYWYEHYDSDDWALDGVAPDTIPSVLTFGQLTPHYHVHVIAMSVRYKF